MPAFTASAPGKIILFGEHAVVYGHPAIAVPVMQVKARASVTPNLSGTPGRVRVQAPDIGLDSDLEDLPADNPLAAVIRALLAELRISRPPALTLRITSTIPMAAGMGSGAAVSVTAIRALAAFLGRPLPDERVASLAYLGEKLYHGTPSGIDNTVITYSKPVYYLRGEPIRTMHVRTPFTIAIGDTGVACSTAVTVGVVRRAREANPADYEKLFTAVGEITKAARSAIESGQPGSLGPLMDQNQALLQEMGVSSMKLDRLVMAAREAGAQGAKLSGGGRGGNMIALVTPETAPQVKRALEEAGAAGVILTEVRDLPEERSFLHDKDMR